MPTHAHLVSRLPGHPLWGDLRAGSRGGNQSLQQGKTQGQPWFRPLQHLWGAGVGLWTDDRHIVGTLQRQMTGAPASSPDLKTLL